MIYQVDKIVRDVRVCLDQNMVSESLLETGDIDTLSLNEVIRSKILEGVKRVHMTAPNYLLEGGHNFGDPVYHNFGDPVYHNFGDSVYWKEMESGWVQLPCDFMRLIVFEMDDWEQAVYTAISTDDPDYAKQRSRFKGIRGTSQNPVCAIAIRPEGRVLEFYSCKSEDATISRAMYLPEPSIDEDGGVDICQRCYTAVVYMISSLVVTTFGDDAKATQFLELSKTALQ